MAARTGNLRPAARVFLEYLRARRARALAYPRYMAERLPCPSAFCFAQTWTGLRSRYRPVSVDRCRVFPQRALLPAVLMGQCRLRLFPISAARDDFVAGYVRSSVSPHAVRGPVPVL